VREKYCWLAGGWKLVLEQCERKTLLSWRLLELPNRVDGDKYEYYWVAGPPLSAQLTRLGLGPIASSPLAHCFIRRLQVFDKSNLAVF